MNSVATDTDVKNEALIAQMEVLRKQRPRLEADSSEKLLAQYRGAATDGVKAKMLQLYLQEQMTQCWCVLAGKESPYEKNKTKTGIDLLLQEVDDPATRAEFLSGAFTVAARADEDGKAALVPYATDLLLTTPELDNNIIILCDDEKLTTPFGQCVVEELQKRYALSQAQERAPVTMMELARQALSSPGGDAAGRLKTWRAVDGLSQKETGMAYLAKRKTTVTHSKIVWGLLANNLRQSKIPVQTLAAHVQGGLMLDVVPGVSANQYPNLPVMAKEELQNGDEKCAGALALLAELEGQPGHKFSHTASEVVLVAMQNLSKSDDRATKENKPDLTGNTLAAIMGVLPKLPDKPQVSRHYKRPEGDVEQFWDDVTNVTEKNGIDPSFGTFLFDLAANPQPIREEADQLPVSKETQKERQEEFQVHFNNFYAQSDGDTRKHLKKHAAARIVEDPENAQVYFDLIENGRAAYKKTYGLMAWAVTACDIARNTVRKPAHEVAFEKYKPASYALAA